MRYHHKTQGAQSCPCGEITVLLRAWYAGDPAAANALMPLVYPVLHRLAAGQMNREHSDHTLQPTALVHEAFLRLREGGQVNCTPDRTHFLALSARLMRQVLVDHARQDSGKRGGGAARVPLDYANPTIPRYFMDLDDVLAVDLAMDALARHDPRKAQVVELRFFGGLTVEETAGVLRLSSESVNRDWRLAKAWLLKYITEAGAPRG